MYQGQQVSPVALVDVSNTCIANESNPCPFTQVDLQKIVRDLIANANKFIERSNIHACAAKISIEILAPYMFFLFIYHLLEKSVKYFT